MSNVLLIESSSSLAKIYAQALEHAGFQVFCAISAQQAINIADSHRPDIVVLEVQLPVHNGIEFLQEFRSYSEWRDIPAIIHTILPPEVTVKAAQALARDFGVKDIFYKPRTSLQDLVNTIRGQLAA